MRLASRGLRQVELLKGELAAGVVELLEAGEAVARGAHHLAGLAHVAKLLGKLEKAHFGWDVDLPGDGRSRDGGPQGSRRGFDAVMRMIRVRRRYPGSPVSSTCFLLDRLKFRVQHRPVNFLHPQSASTNFHPPAV